jgi:hypothetical protein
VPRHDRRNEEEAEVSALRPLLSGIVDYAGLFPPAALDMPAAAHNYAAYRREPDAWMLGRFVVPVNRLGELERELNAIDVGEPWQLSALLGVDAVADIAAADAFNARNAERARVDSLEGKLASTAAIDAAANAAAGRFALFAEIPVNEDPRTLVEAIRHAGIAAKIRTGGITADAFPPAADVVRFMRRCAEAHVPFKATAGLHHPLRAEYRLTYAPDAPRGMMYGYLNLFLAAALLEDLTDAEAIALLEERGRSAIEVTPDALRWRGHELRPDRASAARGQMALSFGSCSFREPVDELHALSLFP